MAEQAETYRVIVNDEQQYAIYAVSRELPAGWSEEGTTGSREECQDHIEAVWAER